MALISCPKCGENISDKAQTCIHCGFDFTAPKKKICSECGNEVLFEETVCPVCGFPFTDSETPIVSETDGLQKLNSNEEESSTKTEVPSDGDDTSIAVSPHKKKSIFKIVIAATAVIVLSVILIIFNAKGKYDPEKLIGDWYSCYNPDVGLTFYSDGKGELFSLEENDSNYGNSSEFTWHTEDKVLRINISLLFYTKNFRFDYEIKGNKLYLHETDSEDFWGDAVFAKTKKVAEKYYEKEIDTTEKITEKVTEKPTEPTTKAIEVTTEKSTESTTEKPEPTTKRQNDETTTTESADTTVEALPFDSMSTIIANDELSKKIQVIKEYTLPDSIGWYTYHYIIIKNNSNIDVSVSTSSLAYDSNNEVLGVDDADIDVLAPGCISIIKEAFEVDEEIATYKTTLKASQSKYNKAVDQDLSYTKDDIAKGAIFYVTNNGVEEAKFVYGYAIFLLNGEIVDSQSTYFTDDDSEIKPGDTIYKQIITYNDFDEIEFYLTGRR